MQPHSSKARRASRVIPVILATKVLPVTAVQGVRRVTSGPKETRVFRELEGIEETRVLRVL